MKNYLLSISFLISILLFASTNLSAQVTKENQAKADSVQAATSSKKEEKGRNVMLNAADNSGPREINMGLPGLNTGMPISENGLPVTHAWPEMPRDQWKAGVGSAKRSLLSLAETTITTGTFGYYVDAQSRIGSPKLDIRGSLSGGSLGWYRRDVSVSAPIANNWSFMVAAYNDADPGSTDLAFTKYASRASLYRVGLTKRFKDNKGKISFLYKYSNASAIPDRAVSIYNEGGEVDEIPGLRMGRDSYVLNSGRIRLLDNKTGEYYFFNMASEQADNVAHSFFVVGDYKLKNNWNLDYTLNYKYAEVTPFSLNYQAVRSVTAANGFTYMDGTPYEGDVQVVLASHNNITPIYSLQGRIELGKAFKKHSVRMGLKNIYHKRDQYVFNRASFYQEVAAQPSQLLNPVGASNSFGKTDAYGMYGYNRNTVYNDGIENILLAYFMDDYQVTPKLKATYGFNARYQKIKGNYSPTARFVGFTLDQAEFENFDHNFFNYSANLNLSYNLTKHFGANGQFLYTTENGRLQDYTLTADPQLDTKVKTPYLSLGVFLNHPKLSIVSAFTYVTKNNFKGNLNLVNPNNPSETNSQQVLYDIKTTAWVNDIVAKPTENFELHYRLTIQNPVYDSYSFSAFGNDYSYDGNTVLQISKTLMEIDPSYTFLKKKMTLWASFRYFSDQTANLTNVLFFKGWWETFAGVRYKMNKNIGMELQAVNLLNQRGVKNTISGAELATDATPYYGNYIVSQYIRPFTLEATVRFNF
ncbi:MAG: hypothetical protein ACK5M7_11540 [Draconibacterium sp.]